MATWLDSKCQLWHRNPKAASCQSRVHHPYLLRWDSRGGATALSLGASIPCSQLEEHCDKGSGITPSKLKGPAPLVTACCISVCVSILLFSQASPLSMPSHHNFLPLPALSSCFPFPPVRPRLLESPAVGTRRPEPCKGSPLPHSLKRLAFHRSKDTQRAPGFLDVPSPPTP